MIQVPKISFQDRTLGRASLEVPQMVEQLVHVIVPVPFFSDWVRWKETHRRSRWYVAWWLRMVPDPFEGSHRQPRAVHKYWAKFSSTSLVSYSCSSSSPSRTSSSFDRGVNISGLSWYAQCKLCRGSVVQGDVCDVPRRCAMLGSTADTCSARLGGFGIYAPRAVFQTFFGMSACRVRGDVCTVDASADHEFHLKSGQHFDDTYSPPHIADIFRRQGVLSAQIFSDLEHSHL